MDSLHNRLSRTGTMEKFASLASEAFQIHGSCRIPTPRPHPVSLFLPALRPVPGNVAARTLGSVTESATCCATTLNVTTMAAIAQEVSLACRSVLHPLLRRLQSLGIAQSPSRALLRVSLVVRNCTVVQVPKAYAMG